MKSLIRYLHSHLVAQLSTSDFKGKLNFNLALGMVTFKWSKVCAYKGDLHVLAEVRVRENLGPHDCH